jgi:type 1 fimbria pilin
MVVSVLMILSFKDAFAGRIAFLRDDSGGVTINVKGIIRNPPPCIINNNQLIDVDFGDELAINKVDGKNYRQNIDYSIVCSGVSSENIKISIQGSSTDFDNATLQTNMPDLGVELQNDGVKLNVGDWVNSTWPDLPVLQAVPVKRTGSNLATGEFNAGATMVVDWQ